MSLKSMTGFARTSGHRPPWGWTWEINAVNAKGNTSMHYSVAYGFEDVTNFLVKAGADDTITNCDGYTPFEMRLAMEGEI